MTPEQIRMLSNTANNTNKRVASNQATTYGIRNQITGLGADLNKVGTNVANNQAGIAGLGQQAGQIQSGIGSLANTTGNIATGVAGLQNTTSGIASGVQGLQGQVTGVGNQITGVNRNLGTLGQGMMAGFGGMAGGLDAATDERAKYYAQMQQLMNGGFANATNQLKDVQSGLAAGQQTLGQGIGTATGKLDAMYSGLSTGQEGLLGAVGDVGGNLNDFTTQYDRDSALATQARTDMQSQIAGGFGATMGLGARTASAQQQGQERLTQAVGGMQAGPAQAQPAQAGQQQHVVQRVANLRGVLAATGASLDPSMRSQFETVATSFDEAGNLIPNANDAQGNTINRQMDPQGNMVTRSFDRMGQLTGQTGVNVPAVFEMAEIMGQSYQPAQQYRPGQLSPANAFNAVAQSGFASPYMQ